MQLPHIPPTDLSPRSIRDFLIRFVVQTTELTWPRGDFAFRGGGGGTRWDGGASEIEDSEVELDDWDCGEFAA